MLKNETPVSFVRCLSLVSCDRLYTDGENNTRIDCVLLSDDVTIMTSSSRKVVCMFRIKFPTKRIFRIFQILRTDGMVPFCNLFIERPSYIIVYTTQIANQLIVTCKKENNIISDSCGNNFTTLWVIHWTNKKHWQFKHINSSTNSSMTPSIERRKSAWYNPDGRKEKKKATIERHSE